MPPIQLLQPKLCAPCVLNVSSMGRISTGTATPTKRASTLSPAIAGSTTVNVPSMPCFDPMRMQLQPQLIRRQDCENLSRNNSSALLAATPLRRSQRISVRLQNGPLKSTEELLTKLRHLLCHRDEYLSQCQEALAAHQRERDEAEILWQHAQRELLNGGHLRSSPSSPSTPFIWIPMTEYASEFEVYGANKETVTKIRDFEDQGWVIPVSGSLRMQRGGLYRWDLLVVKKCQHRPQMQFGIHGLDHEKPWRLVTTSRCSRSRDDDPWQDRPDGDKLIDEGDVIHISVDLRDIALTGLGTFSFSVNEEPTEIAFDDIPLIHPETGDGCCLMPVVSMGGDGSSLSLV